MFSLQRLGDHFSFQKGLGYLGKYLEPSKVALVGLNSFEGGGGYKFGGEKEYSGPYKDDHVASPGDLFISTTDITQDGRVLASPFLMPNLLDKYENVIFSGDIVKATPKGNSLSPEFVYNVLRVKSFRQKAAYASTGSTVRRIPIEVLERLEVPVPPQDAQVAIIRQIEVFDRKIENNVRTSEALEQIAQTIFKSWFVDFDPVHAKARGEQPAGMDSETAALFPSTFENTGSGEIPSGWRIGQMQDLVSLVKATVKAGPSTISKPYVPIDVIRSKSLFLHDQAPSEEAKTSLLSFERGDILFGAMRPYFHKVCLAPFDGTTRSTIFVLRPKSHKAFSALSLFQDGTVDFATKHSQGSTIPYAVWPKGLAHMDVVLPSTSILDAFETIAAPILELGEQLIRQKKSLAGIRDSLLPRLITGELEISDGSLGE
jgi:type I restriction enzyme S subunit